MRPRNKHRHHEEPAIHHITCQVEGCVAPGEFKAPKSRDNIQEYQWYCLDHVREFNSKWDFFAGMNQEEIEWIMKDAVTGHRPTWKREHHSFSQEDLLRQRLAEFFGDSAPEVKNVFAYRTGELKEKKSLAFFDLTPPVTADDIKSRYRTLVKKYHPDMHKGNREYEEMFKTLTEAYRYLMSVYAPS